MKKKCPKCGKTGTERENYCVKCGCVLERDANRCSENNTAACQRRIYEDDDVYCAYCGALTVYAAERECRG